MKQWFYILLLFLFANISPLFAQKENYVEVGFASYYHDKFHGRTTANGESFNQDKMTCAHPELPFGTILRVTNLANGRTITVVVNDRGPFIKGRIIDLTRAGAKELDFIKSGFTKVQIEVIDNDVILEPATVSVPEPPAEVDETINTDTTLQAEAAEIKTTIPAVVADAPAIPDEAVSSSLVSGTDTVTAVYTVVKTAKKRGYSVQISSFAIKSNMERMIAGLNTEFDKSVYVIVKGESGNETYNVMLGLFDNREDAFSYMSKVISRYPDAFIYNYELE